MSRARARWLKATLFLLPLLHGRGEAQGVQPPLMRSGTTLVVLPTLVRTPAGELIHGLQAKDYRVLDDGVPQSVTVEAAERQPIALVVLLQTGGAAGPQLANDAGLGTMLEAMVGGVGHRVAVVSFDSVPEELWSFTPHVEQLREAFTKPTVGDDRAAILDAVNYGISLLQEQPAGVRRVILLVSERRDQGSTATAEEVIRRLGENNVTILGVTLSPEKTWLKEQFTKERHGNRPYKYGADGPELLGTFNLDGPLRVALHAMETNAAGTVAAMSGGEETGFQDRRGLEQQMGTLANHLANSVVLSFRPTSRREGLHTLSVTVPAIPGAVVSTRTSYWTTGETPHQER